MNNDPAEVPDALRAAPPLLLPAPRRVERGEGWVTLRPDTVAWIASRETYSAATRLPPQVACRVSGGWCGAGSVDAQSYRVRVGTGTAGGGIEIEAPSAAGVRYARATLRQLLAQYGTAANAVLPVLAIEDRPVFATRGVMLDVSRCRIPTMQEFGRIIDTLCDLKCNHLQLYTEHTFAYEGHEEAWRGWSPITPDEARELDAMCTARGIELAANQNCFGHLAHWLKMPRYAHLAETHGDWVFDVWPRSGPFSLCPTDPASLAFVRDLLGQLLPTFSSRLVNIGCDETYDIAYGRSKEAVAQRGRAAVYLDFVEQVCGVVREHGKRPMFWGDIALSHPECAKDIPEDAIALAWGYEADSSFDRWCEVLRGAGREAWVCPGTSSWCSITGRTSERRANIEKAAREGLAGGATGLLICDWGDHGHWQQWPVALRGIADGLSAGWSGKLPDTKAVSLHALWVRPRQKHGMWLGDAAEFIDHAGEIDQPLREVCLGLSRPGMSGRLRNQTALFADMRRQWAEGTDLGDIELWNRCWHWSEGMWGDVRSSVFDTPDAESSLVRDELEHSMELMMCLSLRALLRRGHSPYERTEVVRRWKLSRERHCDLWRKRCREGGLVQSCEFFDRVIGEMEAVK